MDIIVDPRFRDKIPKPSEEERRRLEENILADGVVREPLVLWKGTGILVDGHNRWEIIQSHPEIPYVTTELPFENEWDAVAWICRNQLGRRNISKTVYDKLIQEEHDAVQRIQGGTGANQYTTKEQSGENPHSAPKAREFIAKEHGITENAVRSAVEFGRGLDAAKEVDPGFYDGVLDGSIPHKKGDVARLRNVGPEELPAAIEEIRNPSRVTFPQSDKLRKPKKPTEAELEIAKTDERILDKNAVVEYGVDDLLEELRQLHDEFFGKYLFVLDIHRDVATDNEKEVIPCIREFEARWKKEVKEIFK